MYPCLTPFFFSLVLVVLAACQPPAPAYQDLDFDLQLRGDLYVPEGWDVQLWAESPTLFNPTNLDVDIKGRIWVCEAVNYRDFNNPPDQQLSHPAGDRVLILADSDGDGRCDSQKVFVQDPDLRAPVGIAVVGNQVLVSCSPHLICYTDTNGDDRPDEKEIFLTGFGGYDHDHSLHAVTAGPDANWYFNVGNAGPHQVSDRTGWTLRSGSIYTGGSPYNSHNIAGQVSDDGRVWVGGMALRIGADGKGLKVLGHNFRNAYELALDSYGNMWQNDNDDQVVTCRFTWLMEGGNAGYFSQDGSRTWGHDRRPYQDVFTAHWHQDDPGVIPAGDNTGAGSPTGVVVYEGDLFGKAYRGMVLSADAGRNAIFAYKPEAHGAGFRLRRHDLITSLLESTETYKWNETPEDLRKWFRPSDVCVGTDGTLYVADWYDPIVGGHQMHEKQGYGRIYRITPAGHKALAPSIDLSSVSGQVAALCNPAVNVRYAGFVALRAQGEAVRDSVTALLKADNPFHRARAIWLLAQLGPQSRKKVFDLLSHTEAQTRLVAFRALKGQLSEEALLKTLTQLATDPSPAVRRALALTLRDLKGAAADELWLTLARAYPQGDRWYLEALGLGASGKEVSLWASLLADAGNPDPLDWSPALADLGWRLHPGTSIEAWAVRSSDPSLSLEARRQSLSALAFIQDPRAVAAMYRLQLESRLPDVQQMARWWLEHRRTNDWYALWDWEAETEKKAEHQRLRLSQSHETHGFDVPALLAARGESLEGKAVFERTCQSCHRYGDKGQDIGPDLSQLAHKMDAPTLLDALLYPAAGVVFGYEPWAVQTSAGERYEGLLVADGPTVVIKDLTGTHHVIPQSTVESKHILTGSIMPSAQALGLSQVQLADLMAYLLNP